MAQRAHTYITASRVRGAVVYNSSGDPAGHIQDMMIDKDTGAVTHALVSFGGFLGIGDRFHPVPWDLMHYDVAMEGYIVALDQEEIDATPSYTQGDLAAFGVHTDAVHASPEVVRGETATAH